jgi:hypothetical protein
MSALNNPKSSIGVYELPCGFLDEEGTLHTDLQVREIAGDDEEILAATNMNPYKRIQRLMAACTTAIGAFRGQEAIERVIPELTQGDRFYILFAIRRVSLGNDMPLISKCPDCEQDQMLTVDLSELKIKKMPDPMKRTYPVKLPKSGVEAQMKVLIGRGEDTISKALMSGKDKISTALLARIDSIGGKAATLADLKAMNLEDRNFLKGVWEDHEGGIDTAFDVECPSCGSDYEGNVDPTQEGFFNPLAVLKRWRKRFST